MTHQRKPSFALLGLMTIGALVAACENPAASPDRPRLWAGGEECFGKFTGGGRIDPPQNPAPGSDGAVTMVGKVTFGFNVFAGLDANGDCVASKAEIQVVQHDGQNRFHVAVHDGLDEYGNPVSFTRYDSPEGGTCVELHGDVKVNERDQHTFGMQACDNGEPGSSPGAGPDTFWWRVDDTPDGTPPYGNTGRTYLTGGNIQDHS